MSPRPVQDLRSPPRAAADHELRIQLEGAWEVIEQARVRQDALLKPLASRRWRRHLRQRPELLRQVREIQAPLVEALERARHRLEAGAPEDSALRLLLRQVWAQRTRLETLVHERLDAAREHGTSFAQTLERLEERVREPPPFLLQEGEHVLLESKDFKVTWAFLAASFLYGIARIVFREFFGIQGESWGATLFSAGFQFFISSSALLRSLREGHCLLTSRRLVFKPPWGKPRQLLLDSISFHDGITAVHGSFNWWEAKMLTIKSADPKPLVVNGTGKLFPLHALLELHRRPPLLGHLVGPPTYPLAQFPATRYTAAGHILESGVLVLRSGHITFLPERGLEPILQALFETFPSPLPRQLSLFLLLEQLRLLSEADFDHCVDKALRASGGGRWSAEALAPGLSSKGPSPIQLPEGGMLSTLDKRALREALHRIVLSQPRPGLAYKA